MRRSQLASLVALFLAHNAALTKEPRLSPPLPFDGRVQCYTESHSKVTVCSETDGRHLKAVDANGRILWRRDPFVDSKLEPYRNEFPRIRWIGASNRPCQGVVASSSCIAISYDSSQSGVVDLADGTFIFMGQD
jgi:hypothetical protein